MHANDGFDTLIRAAGQEMEDQLPAHEYTNNYGPDFRLHIPVRTGKENLNSPERLARLRNALLENISRCAMPCAHLHLILYCTV